MVRTSSALRQLPSDGKGATAQLSGGGFVGAAERGRVALSSMVASGELVSLPFACASWEISAAWGRALSRCGQLPSIRLKRHWYVPVECLSLPVDVVKRITGVLGQGGAVGAAGGLDGATALMFWKRRHGALGGNTVVDFLLATSDPQGSTARVITLAAAWAREGSG